MRCALLSVRKIEFTGRYRRDFQRHIMDTHLEAEVEAVVAQLAAGRALARHHRDHPLKGGWKGCRDCHVRGDLVLIYSLGLTVLKLHRVGTHSELFG